MYCLDVAHLKERIRTIDDAEEKFKEEWVPDNLEDLNRAILECDAKVRAIVSDPGALQRYEESKSQVRFFHSYFKPKVKLEIDRWKC
jgi:hypothetical protein